MITYTKKAEECPACDCSYETSAELMRHLYGSHLELTRDLTEKQDKKAFLRKH